MGSTCYVFYMDDDGNAKGESTREALLVMVESTGIVGWEKIVYC